MTFFAGTKFHIILINTYKKILLSWKISMVQKVFSGIYCRYNRNGCI